jgi:CO/xanthine dehydrogenase FAD-binding subunit
VGFVQPATLTEALQARRADPDATPIQGGTDLLVELNFGRRRPAGWLDLTRVPELRSWDRVNGTVRIGAGVTYQEAVAQLAADAPALALAARTVGSPQIRNRGTMGGNLGTASPAGDAHPPLLAVDAEVELAAVGGSRRVPAAEFFTGPKQSVLGPDELIAAIHLPRATGPQQFAKVGTRNAMVIAVCSFALALRPDRAHVGTGIGSAGPVPLVATEAESFIDGVLTEQGLWDSRAEIPAAAVDRFGALVAAAAKPIDDVRGSSAYRRRALEVLSRRCLTWAWRDYGRWPE